MSFPKIIDPAQADVYLMHMERVALELENVIDGFNDKFPEMLIQSNYFFMQVGWLNQEIIKRRAFLRSEEVMP